MSRFSFTGLSAKNEETLRGENGVLSVAGFSHRGHPAKTIVSFVSVRESEVNCMKIIHI